MRFINMGQNIFLFHVIITTMPKLIFQEINLFLCCKDETKRKSIQKAEKRDVCVFTLCRNDG